MFANFNRFSALTESSFRVSSSSSRTWKSEDGYLDGKEGEASGFRSRPRLHVLARRRLIGRWVASARLTVPPSSSCEIKKDRTRKPRFSSISTLCSVHDSRETRKATIRNSHFQPLFLPPRTRINIRHSNPSPTTKGTSSSSPVNLTSLRRANKR